MIRKAALLSAFASLPLAAQAEMAHYELDPSHVVVAFLVDHLGYGNVLGRFLEVSGGFDFDPATNELGALEVRVGAASVETHDDPRDGHVRGKDFLNAEAFPEIVFSANGGTPTSDTTGTVTGTLSVRGVEQPLTLDVTLNKIAEYPFLHEKETIGISARGSVLRSDFGMDYGLAQGWVGDQIQILIEAEAPRVD